MLVRTAKTASVALRSGEKLYTMWEQQDGEAAAIMFAASLDFGATFENRCGSPTNHAHLQRLPTFAVAPNKTLCAAWLDFRDQAAQSDTASIYLSCSIDEGSTFSKNLKVADGVCPVAALDRLRPTRPTDGLLARVFPGNIRDMVVSISNDQGNTFAPPYACEDNWKLEGCPTLARRCESRPPHLRCLVDRATRALRCAPFVDR